jgi:hypothetical protein
MSSTTMKSKSKAAILAQLQALVTGLQKELPNGSFTLMSTVYTTATLLPILQGLIAALTAVNTAQKSAEAALVDLAAEDAKSGPIIRALTRTLTTMYTNSPDTLALFELEAPKPRAPLSAAQRAAAVAKAKATREARGTTGAKQKALITGNVTGVTITPITAPVPAPPAAPVVAVPASPPVAATPAPAPPVAAAPSGSPTGHVGQ